LLHAPAIAARCRQCDRSGAFAIRIVRLVDRATARRYREPVVRRKSIVAQVVALALAAAVGGTSRALSEASRIAADTAHARAAIEAKRSPTHATATTKPGVRQRVEKQDDEAAPAQERPGVADLAVAPAPSSTPGPVSGPLLVASDQGRAPPSRQLA
jgi:hypothetical protein